MDQFGLHLEVTAAPAAGSLGTYKAILNVRTAESSEQYCIFLIRSGENEFVRSSSHAGESFVWTNYVWAKNVPQKVMHFNVPLAVTEPPVYIYPGFWLRGLKICSSAYHVVRLNRTYVPNDDRIKLPDDGEGTVGIIQLSRRTGQPGYAWIKLGFGPSLQPMCCVVLPASLDPKAYRYQAEGYKEMQIQAGNLLQCAPDSYLRWEHTIFDNGWTKANERALSGFPWVSESSYEAHMGIGGLDKGFEFTYKGPGFDISISAKRVPDMEHGGDYGVPGEVWALDISCKDVPSAQLEEDKEEKDSSCCFC
ncbi:HET-domain-containing protein [Apiospora arundinis]|uniref:HET-domain-containing protein n=1 Tax=Apiospora arundinis TaxID=335852 RepID=A0ABR2JG96_9PEZI